MVIFIELVQYAKNLGVKSWKNLIEHQIIKMIRKFNSIICRFFAPHSQDIIQSVTWAYTDLLIPNLALHIRIRVSGKKNLKEWYFVRKTNLKIV